jgi:hypothetical protein
MQQTDPLRNGLIKKGMIWSPTHGQTAFTVPMFEACMRAPDSCRGWARRSGGGGGGGRGIKAQTDFIGNNSFIGYNRSKPGQFLALLLVGQPQTDLPPGD